MKKLSCKLCKKLFFGRKDKQFCSIDCKNEYHTRLRKVTKEATKQIDEYLHRNRSILLEIMGKNSTQKKVARTELDKRKFKYKYMTSFYENAQGKRYYVVYDFAWMEFISGEILIVKRK